MSEMLPYMGREHGSRKSYGIQHLFVVRAYAAVCRLGVQRFRIIHHRFYTVFQQSAPELVAVIFRYGQRILVIYVYSHAVFMRQTYHFQITEHIVIVSCRPASMGKSICRHEAISRAEQPPVQCRDGNSDRYTHDDILCSVHGLQEL